MLAGLVLLVSACGQPSSSGGASGGAPTDTGGFPGFGSKPTLVRDADHRYRVVNLHLYNSAPGGAVDIYPVNADDLSELPGTQPLVSALAYGQASEALQPGGAKTAAGDPRYSLGVVPHSPSDPGSANLKLDIYDSNNGQPWHQGLVVLGGTGNGLQAQTFYDTTPPGGTNAVPAVASGAVSLLIDSQHAGDPNGPHPISGTIVVGSAGHCLKATNDGSQGAATSLTGVQDAFVTVPAGTTSLGFWVGGSCAGSPTVSVSLPGTLTAGTRAAVFLYGPDADHLAGVVVPFDS
jgi:hypothetical protein